MKNFINALLSQFGCRVTRCQPREMSARDHLDSFIEKTTFEGKILDVGNSKPSTNANSTTFDITGNPTIRGDVLNLSVLVPHDFDTILAFELLEHVKEPTLAIGEMYKVLKPGGKLYIATPFLYGLHGEDYGDYWRFTRQGLKYLCKDFAHVEVEGNGLDLKPNHYITIATK